MVARPDKSAFFRRQGTIVEQCRSKLVAQIGADVDIDVELSQQRALTFGQLGLQLGQLAQRSPDKAEVSRRTAPGGHARKQPFQVVNAPQGSRSVARSSLRRNSSTASAGINAERVRGLPIHSDSSRDPMAVMFGPNGQQRAIALAAANGARSPGYGEWLHRFPRRRCGSNQPVDVFELGLLRFLQIFQNRLPRIAVVSVSLKPKPSSLTNRSADSPLAPTDGKTPTPLGHDDNPRHHGGERRIVSLTRHSDGAILAI
jgi:hypothetical protein